MNSNKTLIITRVIIFLFTLAYEASIDLLKVLLRIVNTTECQDHYSSDSKFSPLKDGINDNLMCAVGYKSKYHDTCQVILN